MPASSLFEVAINSACTHVKKIEDVGELPYEMVRPILLKIRSSTQLMNIEERSPQIRGADAEVWRILCTRDILGYSSNPVEPKNPINWSKVYKKLAKEAEKNATLHESLLKTAFQNRDAEKQEKKMTFVQKVDDSKLVKPVGPMKRKRLSTQLSNSSRKNVRGDDVLSRAKRQAHENSVFRQGVRIAPRNMSSVQASNTQNRASMPGIVGASSISNQAIRPPASPARTSASIPEPRPRMSQVSKTPPRASQATDSNSVISPKRVVATSGRRTPEVNVFMPQRRRP